MFSISIYDCDGSHTQNLHNTAEGGISKFKVTFNRLFFSRHLNLPRIVEGCICVVVCCSMGVGRTGVFIALSIALERMRFEGVVDMFQTVRLLRTQRPAMVQTEVQLHLRISWFPTFLGVLASKLRCPFLPVWRYASAGTSYGSVCVTSRSCIETSGWIKMVLAWELLSTYPALLKYRSWKCVIDLARQRWTFRAW